MNTIDGMVGGAIPSFGSPTLEGIEFEPTNVQGVYQQKNSGRQFVQFYWKEFYNAALATKENDPNKGYEKKLMVKIVTPGDKNEFDGVAEDYHKRAYFRQYEAFRQGKSAPVGTPVDDADFILAPEATEMRHVGIHTVEQLAEASESACEMLPRGLELREHARAYCKAKHGEALGLATKKLSAELNAAKEQMERQARENADLRQQMAELKDMFRQAQEAQVEAVLAVDAKGKKK